MKPADKLRALSDAPGPATIHGWPSPSARLAVVLGKLPGTVTVRVERALVNHQIYTLAALLEIDEHALVRWKNVGATSIRAIQRAIHASGAIELRNAAIRDQTRDDLLTEIERVTDGMPLDQARAWLVELSNDIALKIAVIDDGEVE